jgi:integrase/recombinase XerD
MSKRPQRKAPKGCYWRDGVIYGRIQTAAGDIRWSLRTDDPKIAARRRQAERNRVIASQRYGDQRRTFAEAMAAWGSAASKQLAGSTMRRYLSSLAVMQPHLEGCYLDEIDKKLIGSIVECRRDIPYVPIGKKHPITVTIATIKRDLTALSSVFDFCVDEEWMPSNPAMEWLKPGHRKKSRLQERRDPIVLPEPAHIQMVIDHATGLFVSLIGAAVKTGARLDELARAERHHFDKGRRQLTVIGKRNKLRVIDLEDGGDDFGMALFSALPATLETKSLFWHRPSSGKQKKGEPAARAYRQVSSNFGRVVESVAKKAQKQAHDFRPFTFHHLRHFHAVNWLKSGRSIYALQQRLGHTSVKTTEMYLAYLTPDEKQNAMFGPERAGTKTGTRPAVESGLKSQKPL